MITRIFHIILFMLIATLSRNIHTMNFHNPRNQHRNTDQPTTNHPKNNIPRKQTYQGVGQTKNNRNINQRRNITINRQTNNRLRRQTHQGVEVDPTNNTYGNQPRNITTNPHHLFFPHNWLFPLSPEEHEVSEQNTREETYNPENDDSGVVAFLLGDDPIVAHAACIQK